jgi:ABC-type oligopeptide transport system substrate-binding subunit/class 3 adenylate cyclase
MDCGARLAQVCPECGTELPADAKFCFECGARVGALPPEPSGARTADDAKAERLQRLVPKAFAERLLATRGQVQRERRMVTILFCDVTGSTAMAEHLDPEDVMEIMDGAFDVLIAPITRYEGTLARLMGDAVLAFFGAPIAHEDDPERACRAALEILEGAQTYADRLARERGIAGLNVRVGINTGLVVVGEVGSDLRVEYTAMGDAINLAARMEQHAPPGGILITHDTYRQVRGVFDVLRQEPLSVKGRREPVRTYLVQRAKSRAFRKGVRGVEGIETRMIGRRAELTRLQEAFYTAVEDRELQMVTVVGDAGVGKSRLLHEFDIWAELLPESFFFFKGRALQEMQGLPYALLRSLFAFRFRIEDTDSVGEVREKLERGVGAALGDGEESRMRAHFIGHLVGFELGESAHLQGVLDDPKQMRDLALTYLTEYFEALASQNPVLMLLEDLHWADDSSLDALNHLALSLTDEALMIACAARPGLYERRPHWGEGQAFHRRLPLGPLTKRNTRRLLAEILQRVERVPKALSELVVAGAEGNPFFVEELIKMLVEDGVIVKGEDRWRVEPSRLSEVRVPPTLTGVLQARLDRLPMEDRSILQQASVVGRLFWDRAVVCISRSAAEDVTEGEVLDTLSDLRAREMVFRRETTAFAGAQEYVFKHNVLREVTYRSLLKRLRRVYHGLVADWLIEQSRDRAGEYTGLIADHLALAGRSAEAIDYLLEAGDRARGLYAHQEAIGAYERALAILKESEEHQRAARVLMKLGLTYHTAFDFERAQEAYEEGFALWQKAGKVRPSAASAPAPHPLRLIESSQPRSLDPAMAWDAPSIHVIGELFVGLVALTPEMDVIPEIARGWEVLAGGQRYVFHLRDDVRWSDGARLTARDFACAWRRVLDPDNDSPVANLLHDLRGARAFYHGEIADEESIGVQVVDDLTLMVELERPTGYFLHLLSDRAWYAVPEHVVSANGPEWAEPENIVTSGPFVLAEWRRGETLVLARNSHYSGRRAGNVERVQFIFRAPEERSAALAMYKSDRLDVLPLRIFPGAEFDDIVRGHADEHLSLPNLTAWSLVLNTDRPPLDDVRIRRALALCMDRKQIAHVIGHGAAPANTGLVPPGMPGQSPGIGLPYDPERARQLLARAGYPGGRGLPTFDILLLSAAHSRPFAAILESDWREELGVGAKWTFEGFRLYDGKVREEQPHISFWAWRADYPDPDNFLRVGMEGVRARHHWENPAYQRLVEQARQLIEQEKRMALYREADRILIEEAVILPLVYGRERWLVKPWLTKYPLSPMRGLFAKDVVIEPH